MEPVLNPKTPIQKGDGIYFYPDKGQFETFKRVKDIPHLATEDTKQAIRKYLEKQEIRLAFDIEPSSCKLPASEGGLQLVSEILSSNPE